MNFLGTRSNWPATALLAALLLVGCGGGGGGSGLAPIAFAPPPPVVENPAPTPDGKARAKLAPSAVASFDQTSPTGYGPRVTPGIEPGVQLRDAPANWSTSADGQVVEGLIFRSPVTIRHARVHFKNCLWLTAVGQTYPGGNHWAFDPAITDDPKIGGLIFEHNDFADALPAFGSGDPNQPWIVRASIMRGTSDGYGDSAKGGSNVLIEDSSFVYEHESLSFAHGDGLQSDVGNVVHMKVRYSYFDVRRTGSNAALLQNEQADEVGDWLIERNYIRSPSAYAIRARNLTGHGRVVIRNNMIERTWIYGPLDSTEHEDMIDWLDNVDEKGQPVVW